MASSSARVSKIYVQAQPPRRSGALCGGPARPQRPLALGSRPAAPLRDTPDVPAPRAQTRVLTEWFDAHYQDPYPTQPEKVMLAAATKMEVRQIEHWFTNKRKRGWRQAMRESSASL